MTGKKRREYKQKCGSCIYFAFRIKNEDTREDGRCNNPKRVNYHQASQKACKLYEDVNPWV